MIPKRPVRPDALDAEIPLHLRAGHLRAGLRRQPVAEPAVLQQARVRLPALLLQQADDGLDVAEREPAVAPRRVIEIPRGPDPAVFLADPVLDGALRRGADDGVALEDEQPFGGREEVPVEGDVGEGRGYGLLRRDGVYGGDLGGDQLAGLDVLRERLREGDDVYGGWRSHEAECPGGGEDGYEVG